MAIWNGSVWERNEKNQTTLPEKKMLHLNHRKTKSIHEIDKDYSTKDRKPSLHTQTHILADVMPVCRIQKQSQNNKTSEEDEKKNE